MATERITIIIDEKGAVTVKKSIASVGNEAAKADKQVTGLRGSISGLSTAFAGLGSLFAVGSFINFSDAATRVANSLRLAGLEGQAFTETQDRLYAAAISNGQVTNDLAAIYQKLSAVQGQLGIGYEETIGSIEGIAAAMRLSTAGTAAQSGSLQQLSQLLGGVMVQAQEYNSLIDGAYPLLQAVANGSDRFKGSVAALTQVAKAGELSVKEFFDALQIGLVDTQAIAASMPLTIGQSFVSLQMAFQQWLADSSSANVAAQLLAKGLQALAQNIDLVAAVIIPVVTLIAVDFAITAVGGAITALATLSLSLVTSIAGITALGVQVGITATAFLASLVPGLWSAVTAFGALAAAILANPFTWIAVGVGVAVAALGSLVYWLTTGSNAFTDLYNKAVEIVQKIKAVFAEVFTFGSGAASIEIKGDKAAAAITEAGTGAGTAMQTGVDQGGTAAAEKLKVAGEETGTLWEGVLSGAAELFGVKVSQAAQNGAAAMSKAAPSASSVAPAANAINKAISSGGKTAGDNINKSIQDGGTKVAPKFKTAIETANDNWAAQTQSSFDQGADTIEAKINASAQVLAAKFEGTGRNIYDLWNNWGDAFIDGFGHSIGQLLVQFQQAQTRLLKAQADLAREQAEQVALENKYLERGKALPGQSSTGTGTDGGRNSITSGGISGGFNPVSWSSSDTDKVPTDTGKTDKVAEATNNRPLTIINRVDPSSMLDMLSTRQGDETIYNSISANPDRYRKALGIGS